MKNPIYERILALTETGATGAGSAKLQERFGLSGFVTPDKYGGVIGGMGEQMFDFREMANVLHKTTLQYLRSVNTPLYMDGNWIINPNLNAVQGLAAKYWKIVGEDVQAMDQGEKDAVDSDLLAPYKVTKKATLKTTIKDFIETKFSAEEQRTLFHLDSDAKANGLTNRLAYLLPYWTWVKAAIVFKHNKDDAIASASTLAEVDSVCNLNWSALEASVPDVSIRGALDIAD